MAPKKNRGRAATSIARVAPSRSMVVEYEPKPDCGPLEPVLEIWTRGSKGKDLKTAGDSHGEGKNEASSLLTKHPDRSHPNITDLHLLPTNNRTRPKKIKFPQPSDPDLDIEVDDDEMQTDGSEGEELKVAGDSHGTGKNEGSQGKELKAAGNSQDDDNLSHGVEHLNVNDPEKKTVKGKKRKLPCSICLSLDHTIWSCPCPKSCPAGTTLAPNYEIVCKCCGELGATQTTRTEKDVLFKKTVVVVSILVTGLGTAP